MGAYCAIEALRARIAECEEKIQYLKVFLNEMCEYEGEYAQTISKIDILLEILDGFIDASVKAEDASFGTLRNEFENKVNAKKSKRVAIYALMTQSHTQLQEKYTAAQILIVNLQAEIKRIEDMIAQIEAMGG